MATRVRETDWSRTPLGPVERWPASLRTALGICLGSRFPMFIWWGPELINLYNDAYIPVLGRRHPAALGKPAAELWREVWHVVAPQVEAVLKRGEASWSERVPLVVERNGYPEEAFFSWSHSPIPDDHGGIGGVICVVTEDTAAIRAERERRGLVEQSRRADERSRTILESITDAFFALDRDWRFTYANSTAQRVLARPGDELIGRVIWDEYPGLIGSVFEQAYRRAAAERVARSVTAFYPDHDRWYEVHAYPASVGGISVYFRNVTERKRDEQALRELAERFERQGRLFEQIASTTPDFIYVFDLDFRFLYANRRLLEVWGRSFDEAVGKGLTELGYPQWHADMHHRELRQVIETKQPVKGEVPFTGGSGISGVYEYIFTPVLGPDGNVEVIAGTTRDVTDRKRTESELAEAKASAETNLARWQAIVASMAEGVILADADGNMLDWNVAALRMHGYASFEEVRTNLARIAPAFRITTPDGAGVPYERWPIPRLLRGESFANWEVVLQRTDVDLTRTVSYSGTPIRDRDGNVGLVLLTLHDVTEARRAQAALRESEGRLRAVVEATPECVKVVSPDGLLSYMNPAGIGMIEADAMASVQDACVFELIAPEHRPQWIERHRRVCAGERLTWEFEIIGLSGTRRWMETHAVPLPMPDGRTGQLAVTRDVTTRKRAEQELRESEERLRLAIEIAQMGTFQIDLLTDAVVVNDPGRRIYGWAAGEALTFGKVQAQFHPDDKPEVLRRVAAAFDAAGPGEFEVEQRIVRTDGATRWIRVRGRAVFEGAGADRRAVRCLGTYLDVTEQRELRDRIERLLEAERSARAEAERQSRMKDEFLATLSHELRTPLNAILGWSQILTAGGGGSPDPQDLVEGLRTIERNARAQTQIIEDLLDMSRIISGKVRLDVQRVDPAGLAQQAVETARPSAEAKGVRLQAVLDPNAGPVSGDPSRLQQVMWNLLSNAVKFTPRGGRVQVVLERVNSHVEFSVTDTGEGIRPEFLPFVFDRFRQADASTTRRHGGLGIGLSIVKQLVELHGGTVRARSGGPGHGATFTVALPLTVVHPDPHDGDAADRRHPRAPTPAAAALPDACIRMRGVTVLVVDDEPDARALVKRVLEDCEAEVVAAASAAEALEVVRRRRPDVLVCDIGMPGEDGYSLIQRIRALGPDAGGAVPALALTAYARAEDRVKAVLAGFQMHVAKPVEPAELIAMVASLAGRTAG